MENPSGQVLVIFGASGDLAKRKLLPALFALHCEGFLPKNFAIVGGGRTEMMGFVWDFIDLLLSA